MRQPNQQVCFFSPYGALFYLGTLQIVQQKYSFKIPGPVLGPSNATASLHGPTLSQSSGRDS